MRLGVLGNLSVINSTTANTAKIMTAAVDPINAKRDPARFSQPRCAAQATTAGAVKDRIPETMPIANARPKTRVVLMVGKMYLR